MRFMTVSASLRISATRVSLRLLSAILSLSASIATCRRSNVDSNAPGLTTSGTSSSGRRNLARLMRSFCVPISLGAAPSQSPRSTFSIKASRRAASPTGMSSLTKCDTLAGMTVWNLTSSGDICPFLRAVTRSSSRTRHMRRSSPLSGMLVRFSMSSTIRLAVMASASRLYSGSPSLPVVVMAMSMRSWRTRATGCSISSDNSRISDGILLSTYRIVSS
mmetsp:Transcript_5398/g.13655  ORF Transcript_5398/g.13655 Transcript_5398/m.13655 type:complete len:219 (+) Transcript_5398:124-780(+)